MSNFINSLTNKLIKHVVKLRDNVSYRNNSLQGVIYGEHLVLEAIKANNLALLLVLDKYHDDPAHYAPIFNLVANNENIYYITEDILHKIACKGVTTDIVALIDYCDVKLNSAVYKEDCIILDNIQDPGNLGTILRSCRASGINNVILSKHTVDIYNPKVLRASQGVQFHLNIYSAVDLVSFINDYQGTIYATTPYASLNLYHQDFDTGQSIAFIFGNEGSGISQNLLNSNAKYVKIPMVYQVESLNVAMCATLCMFELYRQRMN